MRAELGPPADGAGASRDFNRQAALPRFGSAAQRFRRGNSAAAYRQWCRRPPGTDPRRAATACRFGEARAGSRAWRIRIHALRPLDCRRNREMAQRRGAEISRQTVGALRRFRLAAFPADCAARVLQSLSRGQGAVARHVRARPAPAASFHRRHAQVHVLRRAVRPADGAARDRRLHGARLISRRQHRQDPAGAGRNGARGEHAGDLCERSR